MTTKAGSARLQLPKLDDPNQTRLSFPPRHLCRWCGLVSGSGCLFGTYRTRVPPSPLPNFYLSGRIETGLPGGFKGALSFGGFSH